MYSLNRTQYNKYCLQYREFAFYCAWFLFMSTLILNSTIFYVNNITLEYIFKIMRYIAYLLCALVILLSRFKVKNILFLSVLIIGFIFSGIGARNLTFPLYGLILLASINMNIDKTIKYTAIFQGAYLFTIVLLSQMGIIEDYVFDPNGRCRHGLGFGWTTTAPMLFFYLCLSIIYVQRNEKKIWSMIILEALNVWFFYMTDSKMLFYFLSVVILFFIYKKINNKWSFFSKFNKLYILFPYIMFGITILTTKFYNWRNPVWASIDQFLSYRLGLSQNAINMYGLHLLGQHIEWVGFSYKELLTESGTYNYVDNSYLQIALNNGLIFLVLVLAIYSFGIFKAIKVSNYHLVTIYCIILILSLTEPRLMNFAFNPFPLIALGCISNTTESLNCSSFSKMEVLNKI